MKIKLIIRIITGSAEYQKVIRHPDSRFYMGMPIARLGCETLKQLDSEQYILSRGFECVRKG